MPVHAGLVDGSWPQVVEDVVTDAKRLGVAAAGCQAGLVVGAADRVVSPANGVVGD